ncbi:MAG: D-isomer specific 2-hydroxyacid dehydrogenase NAD-binding protein [Candidatus Moranbacteria bacterium GW2011_GWE1_49_15]|nr:MAG: D-isomer specific 2-hydroxyacid dehydrogenase NAD-binding protein [Candidatus Moranbacteria bacterium GW2011_GWE2_47_10]KKW06953.1 MAG: D-isomer specific 2-hydroxyacid dehydrogenase NAD-binding protein [Candidatus Moranbacteria bacterium GW2011_GWE1_49_15]HBP01404.1 hydroxyacid dehydrogenase [Candidatus Moranbacteria bacterium]
MKIAIFEVQKWKQEFLRDGLPDHEIIFFEEPLSEENVEKAKDAEAISVFIYSKVKKETIERLPKLKFIATQSTGFDHIDVEHCKEKGIGVANVPHYGENTVAEHTFALILALSRNVHKSYLRTSGGDFSIEGLKGFDLKDKTLGVIGTGKIGLHVIRMAKGFGMHVKAFDVQTDNFLSEVLHFEYAPLDEVLATSDIVSLHVPYNKNTHHLINKENIMKMKKGALLINTARGGVVDTDALFDALDEGYIGGAALDVLEGEELLLDEKQMLYYKEDNDKLRELVRNEQILKRDNVVFTPHIAFYSQEALERILNTTAENLRAFSEGVAINTVGGAG